MAKGSSPAQDDEDDDDLGDSSDLPEDENDDFGGLSGEDGDSDDDLTDSSNSSEDELPNPSSLNKSKSFVSPRTVSKSMIPSSEIIKDQIAAKNTSQPIISPCKKLHNAKKAQQVTDEHV